MGGLPSSNSPFPMNCFECLPGTRELYAQFGWVNSASCPLGQACRPSGVRQSMPLHGAMCSHCRQHRHKELHGATCNRCHQHRHIHAKQHATNATKHRHIHAAEATTSTGTLQPTTKCSNTKTKGLASGGAARGPTDCTNAAVQGTTATSDSLEQLPFTLLHAI